MTKINGLTQLNLPPTMKWCTIFEDMSTRWDISASTGSVVELVNDGVHLVADNDGGDFAGYSCNLTQYEGNNNPLIGNAIFTVNCRAFAFDSTDVEIRLALGDCNVGALSRAWIQKHAGFKFKRISGGTMTLHASQGNGTTEAESASLVAFSDGDSFDLIFRANSSAGSIDYYARKNNGELIGPVTLTTSYPPDQNGKMSFSAENYNSSTNGATLELSCASWER